MAAADTPLLQVRDLTAQFGHGGVVSQVVNGISFEVAAGEAVAAIIGVVVIFVELDLPAYYMLNARLGYRMLDDKLELGVSGTNLTDFGGLRHREHPFGNQLEARILGTVTGRF